MTRLPREARRDQGSVRKLRQPREPHCRSGAQALSAVHGYHGELWTALQREIQHSPGEGDPAIRFGSDSARPLHMDEEPDR